MNKSLFQALMQTAITIGAIVTAAGCAIIFCLITLEAASQGDVAIGIIAVLAVAIMPLTVLYVAMDLLDSFEPKPHR